MSACLSVTTITCAETMLNAATATISVRMMNITRFSICHRAEEVRVAARPVADLGVDAAACATSSRATARRREQVVELQPHAARRRRRGTAAARPRCGRARARCRTRTCRSRRCRRRWKLLTRGSVPAGVTVPCGVIATTCRRRAGRARARARAPSTMPNSPGFRSASAPRRMCAPMSATASSRAGSMPRTTTPRLASPTDSIACPRTYGAAAFTRGLRRAPARDAPPSRRARGMPRISMCDATDRMRVAQLLLEPVHHRQHDDQRGDAERDAGHRDQRDERDERVAARALAGARVAQADGQFVGRQAGRSAPCQEPSGAPVDDMLIHEGTNDALVKRLSHARVDGRRAKAFALNLVLIVPGLSVLGARPRCDAGAEASGGFRQGACGSRRRPRRRAPRRAGGSTARHAGRAARERWARASICGDALVLAADPVALVAGRDDVTARRARRRPHGRRNRGAARDAERALRGRRAAFAAPRPDAWFATTRRRPGARRRRRSRA